MQTFYKSNFSRPLARTLFWFYATRNPTASINPSGFMEQGIDLLHQGAADLLFFSALTEIASRWAEPVTRAL